MFEEIPTYLHINLSFFILLLTALVSGLFTYYQYRRTVPPISKSLQIILGMIRGFAVACIFLLLFAPEITAIWQKAQKTNLIFAIDKSASMGVKEKGKSRIERAKYIAEEVADAVDNNFSTRIYAFDSDTTQILNLDIDTTDLGTNIEHALTSLSKAINPAPTIILLTDGNFTLGNNPLYSEAFNQSKIYSIGLGDTATMPDLLISEVKANKFVYQHQPTEIQVYITARGIRNQRSPVSLVHKGKVLQAKEVDLGQNGETTIVNFQVTPKNTGLTQYNFILKALPEETITKNNKYMVAIEVLKGKVQVGLLAVSPGYDTKFLRLLLDDLEDINLHISIQTTRGKFFFNPPEAILDSLDVVILYNYHLQSVYDDRILNILEQLDTRRMPALIFTGEKISTFQLNTFNKFIPLKSVQNAPITLETQVNLTVEGEKSPLISIFENDEIMKRFWLMCPPIQYPYSEISFQSPVKIILETNQQLLKRKNKMPVMVTQETRGKKNIFLIGSGFWRWHFTFAEDQFYKTSWKSILRNMIRWLDTDVLDKNVSISVAKKKYQVGEKVFLSTQVYDGSFMVVNDALIRTKILGPSATFEIESEFIQEGRYEGSFVPITPGKYQVLAEAWRNDLKIGEDTKKLYISAVNKEFLHTNQNDQFLKRLSTKTGGKYFSEEEAMRILKYLEFKPILSQESKNIEIWNRLPFLILIMILLSLEWFIRKRKGLA